MNTAPAFITPDFSTALPLYRADDIRTIEARVAANNPDPSLMELAGRAAADYALTLLQQGGRVLVLAGPGNNGGDALMTALFLREAFCEVEVLFTGNAARLMGDAAGAYSSWQISGGALHEWLPSDQTWDLIIDGLFGIGLTRPVEGAYAALIEQVNALDTPILALDVPTGIDADTGNALGMTIEADHTITFIALKPGLLTADGPDHAGKIALATLGLNVAALATPTGATIGSDSLTLPLRPRNSHKGNYGNVGVIGGARGMVGAALLAGSAALQLGAGRVYVGLLDERVAVDVQQPELMLRRAEEILKLPLDVLAIGMGLGLSPDAHQLLSAALQIDVPLIADADALNLLAQNAGSPANSPHNAGLQQLAAKRSAPLILTPHPAEAARLAGTTTADVQKDRVYAAIHIAQRYQAWTVIKGAGSVCAAPNGTWRINTTGNAGMASAGMGDALTGIIAALLAQGANAEDALQAGVFLHGKAGDLITDGNTAITASELIASAADYLRTREDSL